MTLVEGKAPFVDDETGEVTWDEYTDLHDDADAELDRRNVNTPAPYRVHDTRRMRSSYVAFCHVCREVIHKGDLVHFAVTHTGQVVLHIDCGGR